MKKTVALLVLFIITAAAGAQTTQLDPGLITGYFETNKDSLDPIEGTWSVNTTQEFYHYDTLYDVVKPETDETIVIIKRDKKFDAYYLNGESFRVVFYSTDVKGVYLYKNFFPKTNEYSKVQALINKSGEMEFTYDLPESELKGILSGRQEPGTRVVNILKWKKIISARH